MKSMFNNDKNMDMFRKLKTFEVGSSEYISLRNEIVEYNMNLVNSFLNQYKHRFSFAGCEWDDFIQECNIGLIKAVERYDIDKGAFSTYAYKWLYSFASKYSIKTSSPVVLKYRDFYDYYKQDKDELSHSDLVLYDTISAIRSCESLDELYFCEDEGYLYDINPEDMLVYGECIDVGLDEREVYIRHTYNQLINLIDKCLTGRDKEVILLYCRNGGMSFSDMAKEFGVATDTARVWYNRALLRLRRIIVHKNLMDMRDCLE